MRGIWAIPLVGGFLLWSPVLLAQRGSGIEFHGVPASVTSPGIDGRPRGTAASVTDPTFTRSLAGNSFGRREHHHRSAPVGLVPYYGYYAYPYLDYSDNDQTAAQSQQAPPPQVIIVKEEPSDSQDSSRYGEHSFEEDETTSGPAQNQIATTTPPPAPMVADEMPVTTLVYRDGHKSEVRNYAIVGSNLIDLTKKDILKKIPLASLDLQATKKENEDNGVDFHVP
jgi:hypothetical protein